jgi:GNAT superfamily N-acetyltransferase
MPMLIRPAAPADVPAIIRLLRDSLGESTTRKSENLWQWKHEQNPFGGSDVLLAEEGDKLIGVRAFMKWEWQWKGQILKAVRAVDTATHPAHQGKGIFKKLTMHQVDLCKQQGVDFVFNTPNEQSRPGYLKMGWAEQGRMPLKFHLHAPWSFAMAMVMGRGAASGAGDAMPEDPTPAQQWPAAVAALLNGFSEVTDCLATVLSPAYIAWRYAGNPLFRYNYFTDHKYFLLISRVKKHAFGKELRLVDFVLLDPSADLRQVRSGIREMLREFCRRHGLGIISLSGRQYRAYAPCFSWMGWLPVRKAGPVVTLRDLNMQDKFVTLLDIRNWRYSMGDMELF